MSARLNAEDVARDPAFRHLATIGSVAYELRYATSDNFAGQMLYEGLDCAWLRAEAAAGLEAAAAWLALRRPGWRLLVLDALRPHRVQRTIWQRVAGTPAEAYFADPARGSIHSYGMAVDVTLLDEAGREADLGTAFDAMVEASHPALDARHLALGVLSALQVERRGWLSAAMAAGGFHGIGTEWWHFDHGQRERVRRELPRVE